MAEQHEEQQQWQWSEGRSLPDRLDDIISETVAGIPKNELTRRVDERLAAEAFAKADAWARSDPGTPYGVTMPVRAAATDDATDATRAAGAAAIAGGYPRWSASR